MFVPDSTILVAAHKYSGAQEIMQKIRYAYEAIPDYIRAGAVDYNKGSLVFDNKSRIVSATTTENTGRGMAISLLYCDEFAFVRPSIATEFWVSISPTLSTGGKAIITSTPNSDEDQFALMWKQANKCIDEYGNKTELGINGFKAFTARWSEHPDRDEAWAKQQQAILGEERFRREIGCEFLIFDETLINAIHLLDMQGVEPIMRQGQVRWYKKPTKDNIYVIALDPSLGTGSDPAAIQVFELPSFIQVAEWQHNKTLVQKQVGLLAEITKYIYEENGNVDTNIYYSIENNTLGEAALVCVSEIGEEKIHGIFLTEPRGRGTVTPGRRYRKGFNTGSKSKIAACAKLKSLIEGKRLAVTSKNLVSELKNFVAAGVTYAAKPGETDDLVMATLLAVRMSQVLQAFDTRVDESLKDTLDEMTWPLPFIVS